MSNMRSLTIASGFLFIATGVFCFINPGQTFMTMAFVVGSAMVIWGIIHILSYLIGRGVHNRVDNNGWIFIDAFLTLLLGVLILLNQLTVDMAVPMILGMWVMVSGLLRLEAASRIDRHKKKTNFNSALITGAVTTMIGFIGFINPLFSFVSVIIFVGLFMTVQGINTLELGINMPHEKKAYVKIYKRKRKAVLIDDSEEESVNKEKSENNEI